MNVPHADADEARARTLEEIKGHVLAWNTSSSSQRARLLRAALPVEAAAFVAHSNALEGVPTLSAADMLEMVQQTTSTARDEAAQHAALNTYNAFRLARAFRLERSEARGGAADELLWHVPQALAVHRTLMAELHPRAGRLRVNDARPKDRAELYVPAAAVPATVWSFFDVANSRALALFPEDEGEHADFGHVAEELSVLDEDDAVCEDECLRILSSTPPGPDLRDIDPHAVEGVVKHAAWFAGHFLEVHPFGDGNGRLTRILLDSMLARVHPVPAPLVPAGATLEQARTRYIDALREVPPWALSSGSSWATEAPSNLSDLILESLLASWRRLAAVQQSLFGGGEGPFLGVLVLSMRASMARRRARYAVLGHRERTRVPSSEELDAEASALPLPPADIALVAGSPFFLVYAPTGHLEEGWCRVGWMP